VDGAWFAGEWPQMFSKIGVGISIKCVEIGGGNRPMTGQTLRGCTIRRWVRRNSIGVGEAQLRCHLRHAQL
jgi:hypothetical protein